jgi:REP element-mobilizing transposase RayT
MKPGTFTQIYIQVVFSPMYREALLFPSIRPRIFEYMSGITTNLGHKSIIINGVSDHVHILIGFNPNISLSETVKEIKRASSVFINEQRFFPGSFQWQSGYGGFSYSHSQLDRVYKYILNQEKHHHKKTFREEYLEFLQKNEIEFSDQYLFEFFD